MSLAGKKLGILISVRPDSANFNHGLGLAQAALEAGVDVYVYCIDDAVHGVPDPRLQALRGRGLKLYACAYGAQRRHLPLDDLAVYAGLTVVSDLIAGTDRFVSFNQRGAPQTEPSPPPHDHPTRPPHPRCRASLGGILESLRVGIALDLSTTHFGIQGF